MDPTWAERIHLFQWAILAALVAGTVCPLVGTFLLVRRTSFYGITLPQFAAAGVVFGFVVLPWWSSTVGGVDAMEVLSTPHSAMNYKLAWAALFTFGSLVALVLTGRKAGSEIGRVAAAFAIANAATYLFGRMSPVGKSMVDELLAGEILGIGRHEFETLSVMFAIVFTTILILHRDFLFVSYDRESAVVLGKPVLAFEIVLNVLTGITVAVGTMFLGPTLLFGMLILPPLAARRWAGSTLSFHVIAVAFGIAAVVGGIFASFQFDLPLGAAIVGVAALELVPGLFIHARA